MDNTLTENKEIPELTREWGVYKYALANLNRVAFCLGEFETRPDIYRALQLIEAESAAARKHLNDMMFGEKDV